MDAACAAISFHLVSRNGKTTNLSGTSPSTAMSRASGCRTATSGPPIYLCTTGERCWNEAPESHSPFACASLAGVEGLQAGVGRE